VSATRGYTGIARTTIKEMVASFSRRGHAARSSENGAARSSTTATKFPHQARPHHVRRAKNRKGDAGSQSRGRTASENATNAEAGQSGAGSPRQCNLHSASRPENAEGTKTSREASDDKNAHLATGAT
jgi:hypothetical protein